MTFSLPINLDSITINSTSIILTNVICSDLSIITTKKFNIANSVMDSSSYCNAISSGGSSSSTPVIIPNIQLYTINVSFEKKWTFDKLYNIQITTFNISGSKINLNNVTVKLLENIKNTKLPLKRIDNGTYEQGFIIQNQNITELNFEVRVQDHDKIIVETYNVKLAEESQFVMKLDSLKDKTYDYLAKYWLYSLITFICVVITLILFINLKNDIGKFSRKK